MAEQFIGRLVRAIDINYSVHALLQRSHTPVADMSAVVVITEEELPEVVPGGEAKLELAFTQSEAPVRVKFEVLRPTDFSAGSLDWKG